MQLSNQTGLRSDWGIMNTRDPSRACAHLSSLFRPHKLRLSRHNDDIRFTHNRIELDGLSINTLSYGKEITIDAPNNLADSYLVKFTLQGHSEVNQSHNSCTTQAGTICVLNPSLPLKDRMSEDFQMMIVQIQEKLLYAHLAKELGVEVNRPLDFQTVSVSMEPGQPVSPDSRGCCATTCPINVQTLSMHISTSS